MTMENYSFDNKSIKISPQYESSEEYGIAKTIINDMWDIIGPYRYNGNVEIHDRFKSDDFHRLLESHFGKGSTFSNICTGASKHDFDRSFIGRWVDKSECISKFMSIQNTYGLFGIKHMGYLYVWCPFNNYGLVMQNDDMKMKQLLKTTKYPLHFMFATDMGLIPDVKNIDWLASNVRVLLISC